MEINKKLNRAIERAFMITRTTYEDMCNKENLTRDIDGLSVYVTLVEDLDFITDTKKLEQFIRQQQKGQIMTMKTKWEYMLNHGFCKALWNSVNNNMKSVGINMKNEANKLYVMIYDMTDIIRNFCKDVGYIFGEDEASINMENAAKSPQRHFNSILTDSKYLAADTDFAAWVWVCTGRGKKVPTEPLKWLSQQNLLACAVDKLFGNSNAGDLWEVAAACFLVKGKAGEWKRPNVDAMKNTKGKTNGEKKITLLNLLNTATRQKEK